MNEDKFAKIIRYQVNISEIDNKWISLKLNTDSSKKKITKEIKKFLENLQTEKILVEQREKQNWKTVHFQRNTFYIQRVFLLFFLNHFL